MELRADRVVGEACGTVGAGDVTCEPGPHRTVSRRDDVAEHTAHPVRHRAGRSGAQPVVEARDDLCATRASAVDDQWRGLREERREVEASRLGTLGGLALLEELGRAHELGHRRDAEGSEVGPDQGHHHFEAAFLVRAPTVQQVAEFARRGETMPQKSTFFYPKVPTGLVFNLLEG